MIEQPLAALYTVHVSKFQAGKQLKNDTVQTKTLYHLNNR